MSQVVVLWDFPRKEKKGGTLNLHLREMKRTLSQQTKKEKREKGEYGQKMAGGGWKEEKQLFSTDKTCPQSTQHIWCINRHSCPREINEKKRDTTRRRGSPSEGLTVVAHRGKSGRGKNSGKK